MRKKKATGYFSYPFQTGKNPLDQYLSKNLNLYRILQHNQWANLYPHLIYSPKPYSEQYLKKLQIGKKAEKKNQQTKQSREYLDLYHALI